MLMLLSHCATIQTLSSTAWGRMLQTSCRDAEQHTWRRISFFSDVHGWHGSCCKVFLGVPDWTLTQRLETAHISNTARIGNTGDEIRYLLCCPHYNRRPAACDGFHSVGADCNGFAQLNANQLALGFARGFCEWLLNLFRFTFAESYNRPFVSNN